jgi:hypothetical protein
MSDQSDSGSKDRATVALVYHAVDGLKELTKAGFTDVQRQLDNLATLPTAVAALHERITLLEVRVTQVEGYKDSVDKLREGAAELAEGIRLREEREQVTAATLAKAQKDSQDAWNARAVSGDRVFGRWDRIIGGCLALAALLRTFGVV